MDFSQLDLIALVDSLPVFIGVIDAQQRYEFVNATYEKRFGAPRNSIIGQTVESLNGTEEYEKSRQNIEKVLSGIPVEFEYQYEEEFFQLNYLPRFENELVTGYYVISANTSQLRRANLELNDMKHGLQNTLDEYLRLAEVPRKDRLDTMGEMAAYIAHEISQPILASANYLEVLSEMLRSESNEISAESRLVLKVQKAIAHCEDVIARLRDFSAKKAPTRSLIRLDTVIENAVALVAPIVQKHKVELTTQFDANHPVVEVNDVEIQQVVVNLVSNSINALKANSLSNRKIEISCYGDPTDRFVVVRIEDNGSGIPPNIEPEDLFSAFESKTPDGMGVGLFISRSIIQAHGGKLIFDSNYRDGAAFEFRIPIPNLPT